MDGELGNPLADPQMAGAALNWLVWLGVDKRTLADDKRPADFDRLLSNLLKNPAKQFCDPHFPVGSPAIKVRRKVSPGR
jgi:hypothetical protein